MVKRRTGDHGFCDDSIQALSLYIDNCVMSFIDVAFVKLIPGLLHPEVAIALKVDEVEVVLVGAHLHWWWIFVFG